MNTTLSLALGALCDPLSEQIKKQGFAFDEKEVEHFQEDVNALNRLRCRGYIPDRQMDRITNSIFKNIQSHIIKMNRQKRDSSTNKPKKQ